jgi:hypothetical protein
MIPNVILALTPAERLAAAGSGMANNPTWPTEVLVRWSVWLPVVVAVVAGILLITLYRRWNNQRMTYRACLETADQLGLTAEERAVILRIAALADLERLEAIFSMPEAFIRGADRLLVSETIVALPPEGQAHARAVVDALRTKLGFRLAAPLQPASPQRLPLEAGAALTVVSHEAPRPTIATILQVSDDGIMVQTEGDVEIVTGAVWRIRYTNQGMQWEVDARVAEGVNQRAYLKLTDQPRCVNRRRFIRVPIHRTAYLARFPFARSSVEGEVPTFVEGVLTEIAGPGVRIETSLRTRVGERVLVVMKLADDKMVQAIGVVRRTLSDESINATAIELLGLAGTEINELVQETNAAARRLVAAVQETETEAVAVAQSAP